MLSIQKRKKAARRIRCDTDPDLVHAIRICFLVGLVDEGEAQRAIESLTAVAP